MSSAPDTVTIRRGKRTDWPALLALLFPAEQARIDKAQARHWRRLASDPAHDFYVAEQAGSIRGVVLICYVRALRNRHWRAILDIVVTLPTACEIGHALLNFAKMRAHKRGCQRLLTWKTDPQDEALQTLLIKGGFRRSGEVLSCGLGSTNERL